MSEPTEQSATFTLPAFTNGTSEASGRKLYRPPVLVDLVLAGKTAGKDLVIAGEFTEAGVSYAPS